MSHEDWRVLHGEQARQRKRGERRERGKSISERARARAEYFGAPNNHKKKTKDRGERSEQRGRVSKAKDVQAEIKTTNNRHRKRSNGW